MKKNLFSLLGLFLCLSSISAQVDNNFDTNLTDEQKEEMKERIIQKLDDFQDELRIIAAGETRNVKNEAKDRALDLFIGEGEPYPYIDNYGNRKMHKAAQMQTSSRRRGIVTQSMKSYLNAVSHMEDYRYQKVEITQAGAVRVSNIYQKGNEYIAIASIFQKFVAYTHEGGTIIDYDVKTVKVHIKPKSYMTPDGQIVVWEAKLGDFKVTETWH